MDQGNNIANGSALAEPSQLAPETTAVDGIQSAAPPPILHPAYPPGVVPDPSVAGRVLTKEEERILRLQQQAREYEEVERQRHEKRIAKEKRQKEKEAERAAHHIQELESSSKKMFWIGLAFCPLVWILMIMYFWKEIRDKSANPIIRSYCRMAIIGAVIYNIILITWYTVFLVFRDTKLADMNILLYNNDFTPVKF